MTSETIKSPFYILFVDDEENARKYFDKGLKHDFNILTAASVDEAQKIVIERHREIAVVVTDQRMPGGNGVKLLKFLRENYPHLIRLLTTAYSDLTEAIEAVNSGEIFRYVQKPWDYNLLKTELHQAIELFELRFERNELLREKMMVRKKITKIERAKSLLLIAKNLNFIRFSDIAVQNFIKSFATGSAENEEEQNWQSLDFGNSDILETKFIFSVVDKIQKTLPSTINYGFNDDLNHDNLAQIFAAKQNLNPAIQVKISNQIQAKSNLLTLAVLVETLLKSQGASAITVDGAEGKIVINLRLEQSNLPVGNIFTANPQMINSDFYVNLLICYLLAGHHGGMVELTSENQALNCLIKLPNNPEEPSFSSSYLNSMENTILATMLC